MAVEYKRELHSVTVAGKLVTAEYNDTFLVDGKVKATAVDQDTFNLSPSVFVEENGKLRVEGGFPAGSDLALEVDGEKIQFQLTENVAHFQVGGFIPLPDGLMFLVDSVNNADETDFYSVYTFQKYTDPDADPTDVVVSNVSLSAPAVVLPDDVKAMLRGVVS
jgi:hypothetical protein